MFVRWYLITREMKIRVLSIYIYIQYQGEESRSEGESAERSRELLFDGGYVTLVFARNTSGGGGPPSKRSRARLFTPHGIPEKRNRSLPRECRAAPVASRPYDLSRMYTTARRGASTHPLALTLRSYTTRLAYRAWRGVPQRIVRLIIVFFLAERQDCWWKPGEGLLGCDGVVGISGKPRTRFANRPCGNHETHVSELNLHL